MKKKILLSAMLLFSIVAADAVFAQTADEIREQRMLNRLNRSLANECEDDDQYMAEIGYGQSPSKSTASSLALLDCQNKLKMRLEQTVQGIIMHGTAFQELSDSERSEAASLTKNGAFFKSVVEKTIGRTIKCYADVKMGEKVWEAEFNGKIAVEEFIKEFKNAVNQDAALRTKTDFDALENDFHNTTFKGTEE